MCVRFANSWLMDTFDAFSRQNPNWNILCYDGLDITRLEIKTLFLELIVAEWIWGGVGTAWYEATDGGGACAIGDDGKGEDRNTIFLCESQRCG